jgi:hypothetical protein
MPSIIPNVPILLDRARTLRFDRRAVFTAERELAKLWQTPKTFYGAMISVIQAVSESRIEGLNLNDIAVVLWQGLLYDDPMLTLEQVQDMLPTFDMAAMVPICAALLDAWNIAAQPATTTPPEETVAAEEPGDPLAPSRGSASGALSGVNSV